MGQVKLGTKSGTAGLDAFLIRYQAARGKLNRLGMLDPEDEAQAKQELKQWKRKVECHATLPWMQGLDAEIPTAIGKPR